MSDRLQSGQTYKNKRGDFISIRSQGGYFFDQYGRWYDADGTQIGHAPRSTGNIDLGTAGATDGWRDEEAEVNWVDQREADEREDEAKLYREGPSQ